MATTANIAKSNRRNPNEPDAASEQPKGLKSQRQTAAFTALIGIMFAANRLCEQLTTIVQDMDMPLEAVLEEAGIPFEDIVRPINRGRSLEAVIKRQKKAAGILKPRRRRAA